MEQFEGRKGNKMTLRGREFFSQEQRDEFMKIPEDEWILGTYYTFSKHDLEIIKRHRRGSCVFLGKSDHLYVLPSDFKGLPTGMEKSFILLRRIGDWCRNAKNMTIGLYLFKLY